MNDDNITQFPVKRRHVKTDPNATLQVVQNYDCRHGNFLIDEKLGEVECGRCKAKLNPIWVLGQIAMAESELHRHWAHLKAEIELMKPRLKTKCENCGKLTPIPTNVKTWDIQQRAFDLMKKPR